MTENELKQMPLPALQALKGAIDARLIELETLLPLQLSSPLPGTGDAKKPANGASTPKKEASIGPARYAKPGDPSVTWTGRGRNPTWVKTHLASGRPLAELEIH